MVSCTRVNGRRGGLAWHCCFFFSSRRRHTRLQGDWSSDVCSSDLGFEPICKTFPAGESPDSQSTILRVAELRDRKSTRLNSSHLVISYAVFCLKKKMKSSPLASPGTTVTYIILSQSKVM